jgi:hypothetical protein
MSRTVEEWNRRLLRARDAMDPTDVSPLDLRSLARVVFTQEPLEQDSGIEFALRDPFGNQIHIVQRTR